MKKFTAIFCALAMLAALAGCDNGNSVPESGSAVSAPESTVESSGSSSESAPASSESSESLPEESAPKGEPTFLTCVDGTVIYTSDITELEGAVYDVDGQLEQFSLDDLDEERFLNCDYMVVCGGFAYAFTPKYSFNPAQNPELFETVEGIDNYWNYVGETFAPSGEYYRVGVGDKFGALTVKSAETEFYSNYMNYDMSINGAYTWSGTLEFDGELELTGYISVSNPNEGYDEGGEMRLVLDNECAGLIPLMKYEFVEDAGAVRYCTHGNWDSNGYGDYNVFKLGKFQDYDIDLDGLEIGEHNVHVKITVGDIVSRGSSGFSEVDARVLSLEKI